jgi:hypothetical protein
MTQHGMERKGKSQEWRWLLAQVEKGIPANISIIGTTNILLQS